MRGIDTANIKQPAGTNAPADGRGIVFLIARFVRLAFDSAAYLDSDSAIGAYMEEALATDDPAFIAKALGTVARARGMAQIAKKAGLSRESLYKALSAEGNPEFSTIIRVMHALGLKFSVDVDIRFPRFDGCYRFPNFIDGGMFRASFG